MRKLILLIGPTCSGKSTLEKALNANGIPSIVSYTTRAPRTGEIDGVDYHFLTREDVDALEITGQIVQKVEFTFQYYGSTLDSIENAFAKSDVAVIVVEPTGLSQFLEYASNTGAFEVVSVYVNGTYASLVTRLLDRYAHDRIADPAYYWFRLVQQDAAFHEWPHYTQNWNVVLDQVDDEVPGKTVQDAIVKIMGAIVR